MATEKNADEMPVQLNPNMSKKTKSTKQTRSLVCIVHFTQNKSDKKIRPLSEWSFKKIQEVCKIRQSQERASDRLDSICSMVPEFLSHSHGYHRWCYSNFTNISRLLKRKNPANVEEEAPCPKRRRTSLKSSSLLLPPDQCLFCDRNRMKIRGKEIKLVKCQTKTAEESIKAAVERKQDERMTGKVVGIDLVAREAHYHLSCRKSYTRDIDRDESNIALTDALNAHKEALDYICQYIFENIVTGLNVERLSMLRERYMSHILENNPQFYNANYKTYKLKDKLIKRFGNQIKFWQPNYRSELVFSSGLPKGQAVETAFEMAASESKRLEESALFLRRVIQNSLRESEKMPWPPSSAFLQSGTIDPPAYLQTFLAHLITGKKIGDSSNKQNRLVKSFGQDLCAAVTSGKWMMPKHLLLGMTLRHLTGSAEIITLVHRFGHCSSYSTLLELETTMCRSIDARDKVVPPTVKTDCNVVTHLCWDNFDMREETPSGAGTTHTAHGIILQETSTHSGSTCSMDVVSDSVPKTKERSIIIRPKELQPCFMKSKSEPQLTITTAKLENTEVIAAAQNSDMLWILARASLKQSTQRVPSWAGWVSVTGNNAGGNHVTTIDYMPPIFSPITENATVQEVLKTSQDASREVGQPFTIVTFDLAVAKKAYALVWQNPNAFGDCIVRLGGFHLTCSYMGALGKSIRCSGFEEILIESGVCASGSIEKVMTGKHYNRALRVHKLILEAMERLLLQVFELRHEDVFSDKTSEILGDLAKNPCKETLSKALNDESCKKLMSLYYEFKDKVRQGILGKTAQFWLNYMDNVELILQFQRATKENNLDLHLASLQNMCSLFFSYDHQNYARYATVYLLTVLNISESHPGAEKLLKQYGFSVNRSEVPSSRNAVDITIEQTINRHAKSHSGIVGFSRNQSAYYRWCMTRHARGSYHQATMEMVDIDSDDSLTHKDLRPSQIAKSEEDVRKIVQAISNFINPFDVDNRDVLYCLSSGSPAPKDVEHDLLQANTIGKEAYESFVQERFVDKTKSFNAPIKRRNLKTFANLAKSAKVTGLAKKSKEITAERNVFGQLVILALEHQLSMERVLSFSLGPVPWALATSDGSPVKTDKSKLLHALEGDLNITTRPTGNTSYIVDGNALLQAQMALPNTFGELAENVFDQLPKAQRVDFVTDSYLTMSIKGIERERRGSSQPHLIKGALTKVPRNWKSFMSNDKNKQQLVQFLLDQWKSNTYAPKLLGRKVIFVCEERCFSLTSEDGKETMTTEIHELNSTQEEADTRIILHCLYIAANSAENYTIIVRSPDTDVFILLLAFTQGLKQRVLFDTGVGNKRRLIDMRNVIRDVGQDMCLVLPALHAFSGCDTTSAFVRKGKLTVLKTLRKYPNFMDVFRKLGTTLEIEDHVFERLEHFTCLMYGNNATSDINMVRYGKFMERFSAKSDALLSSYDGVDMSILPPCRDSLRMHIRRANYQALVWYQADNAVPNTPPPHEHGWEIVDGRLQFKWSEGELMPQELIEVLMDESQETVQDDEEIPEFQNLTDYIFEPIDD